MCRLTKETYYRSKRALLTLTNTHTLSIFFQSVQKQIASICHDLVFFFSLLVTDTFYTTPNLDYFFFQTAKMQRFLVAVKDRMLENPFHNWLHVFNTTQVPFFHTYTLKHKHTHTHSHTYKLIHTQTQTDTHTHTHTIVCTSFNTAQVL